MTKGKAAATIFFGPGLALIIASVVIADRYGLLNHLLGYIGGALILGGIVFYLIKRP